MIVALHRWKKTPFTSAKKKGQEQSEEDQIRKAIKAPAGGAQEETKL